MDPKTEAVNDESLHTHYVKKEFSSFPLLEQETRLKILFSAYQQKNFSYAKALLLYEKV